GRARSRGGQRLPRQVRLEGRGEAHRLGGAENRRRRVRADHGAPSSGFARRPGRKGRVALLSDVFIRRPVLATVCSLLIILAGAICIPLLPIARYPALAPPAVTITALYTGANAQAVESAVTTPIEQVVNGVEGMTYIQSSST